MTTETSFSRKLAGRAPLFASVAGMVISLSSAVLFFGEDDFRRILGVTVGLFCLLLAVWFAAHPFVRNERRYPELRGEVVKFVDLAKELHHAAVRGDDDAFQSIKEKVPAQVETVIDTARKSEAIDPTGVGE
ncbi:MAG: hypothetical protein IIC36_04630 [Gemmatimonadetes bacterium]|nr:hypothetical protein [Gemmatimonadota bacterium]